MCRYMELVISRSGGPRGARIHRYVWDLAAVLSNDGTLA